MRTEIKELHQRLKTTTVYVTHDQIEAMTMADKIVILKDGVIEQEGRPLDVYDKPANLFVAGFIGSPAMNLIKGTAEAGGVRFADGTLMPFPKGKSAAPGKAVVYGIRPEHLRPVSSGGAVQVKADVMEPTGPELHVYATLGGEEICAVTGERLAIEPGQVIGLAPVLDSAHLFDAETGRAI
jgi:multiple sugar transport system ATP-binding protein